MNVVAIIIASQETCSGRAPRETPEWRRPACLVASIFVFEFMSSPGFSPRVCLLPLISRETADCHPTPGKPGVMVKALRRSLFGKTNTKEATTNF